MRFPFEVSFAEIRRDPEPFVDAVFGSLVSEFMVMPRGKGFVEFRTFRPCARQVSSCPAFAGS